MIKFSNDKVLLLQQLIIESSGGTAGIRDFDLLDSALNSCFQTFDGKELYPTKEEKAARLGFSLVSNHAFVDGNKRIGILVMLSFLEINGIHLKYTDKELIDIGLSLAEGSMGCNSLLRWINDHKI
ncbi:MAG: type II toxin-antitoxin system death-on-curing family toxin [Clostridia bacterium]|nr:type II toxin-antitoxin system death-on-curing family toxin [Clostridia bacterium]